MKFYDSNEDSSLTFCYSVAIYVVQWEIYGNSLLFLLLFSPYLVCRNIELWCCFSKISSKFSWSLRNRMQCRNPCAVFMFSLDILSPAIWARFTSAVVILSSSLLSYIFFVCKKIIYMNCTFQSGSDTMHVVMNFQLRGLQGARNSRVD